MKLLHFITQCNGRFQVTVKIKDYDAFSPQATGPLDKYFNLCKGDGN
jgi:hypothetical protein